MLYAISWTDRPHGSAHEYEAAQKRILGLFRNWDFPASIKVQQFLVNLGEWGGLMIVESDDATAIHKMTSIFPAFAFHVQPVVPIGEAVQAELEAIAWRDEQQV